MDPRPEPRIETSHKHLASLRSLDSYEFDVRDYAAINFRSAIVTLVRPIPYTHVLYK